MTRESEYTTFLDLVNRLSERRQTVTATYLSVNAALIGAVAFLFQDGSLPDGSALITKEYEMLYTA